MKWHELFVYGTLKKNEKYHSEMGLSLFLGHALLKGPYEMYLHPEGQYPLVIHSKNSGVSSIYGELWRVQETWLSGRLDPFENVPIEYKRERVLIHKLNGDDTDFNVEAFIYLYQPPIDKKRMTRILSGRFSESGPV